ncbi:hypothetical protein ELI16_14340 [Rhizobium ruizarguesonis]|uniref:hypothetical protein n=1 Tax=Rhizobium ruizarguesonis TaxID=2081791 RepID=UPI0010316A36|nr:hypothetical protein [Rhizobium ruizarguesonis]TAW73032.1 hypothetical protein ELI16_14340 [Rhizobium ruizarguesonis]
MHSNEYTSSDFPRDRALPFFGEASYAELAEVLPMPKCATKRQENVMAGIVAGMAHHVRMRPADRFISYSRDRSVYPGQEVYYGNDWGYGPVVGSIDTLADNGWFSVHDRKKQMSVAQGQQSRFIPDPAKFTGIALPKTKKSVGELIRLRDRKERVLIPYKETEAVNRMRKFVSKINGHLQTADIQFTGGVRRDGSVVYFENIDEQDGRLKTSAVDLEDMELYRVFNDAWTLGGRYYGGCWQGMPKGERKNFVIDGESVVEHDYKNNHPSILYIAEGKPLDLDSGYDAYDIGGFQDQRLACKRALNIMLNARNYKKAVGAVREHVASGTYKEAKELVEALKVKHAAIAHHFFSDVGLKLQRLDAEMCREVLNEMTVKRGETVMPIHDSFIVRASAADELARVMSSVFNRCTANVTNSSFVSKTFDHTILNTGASLPGGRVGVSSACVADSDSESESETRRNRKKIQNRNRKAACTRNTGKTKSQDKTTGGGAMRRFSRIKTRTVETASTDMAQSISTTPSLVEQENRPARPVKLIRDVQTSVDTANALEQAVVPVSCDYRHNAEVKESSKAVWQPRKTTVLNLIREEELRRDARRNGKLKPRRE